MKRDCFWLPLVLLLAFLPLLLYPGNGASAADAIQSEAAIVPERQVLIEGREPPWKERWDKARQLVRQGDYGQAIDMYGRVLADKPGLEEVRWELARIYLRLGEGKKALALLESLHEENPSSLLFTAALGGLLVQEKKFVRAKILLEEVLRRQGDTAEVLRDLIMVEQQAGRREELFESLRRYIRLVPDDDARRKLLAQTAYDLKQFEQARTYLMPLVDRAPGDGNILRLAARIHDRLDLGNLARKFWSQLLALHPEDPEANLVLASFFEEQPGMEQQALAHLLAIADLKGRPEDYDLRVASLYVSLERFSDALPYLERIHRKFPDEKLALRLLINTRAALGDREQTLALLEEYFVLEENPDPRELRQAADLYEDAGRFQEAIPLYRTLLEQSPQDPELLEVLARDLLVIGEEEGALGMWKMLAEKSPKRIDALQVMSNLLEKLGRDGELIDVLLRLTAMQPDDVLLQLRLAEAYRRTGDRDDCAKVVSRLYNQQLGERMLLFRRARLGEYLNWCGHALDDYLALMTDPKLTEEQKEACRLAALRCAGKTGNVKIITSLAAEGGSEGMHMELVEAAAYRDAGDLWQAEVLYRQVLNRQRISAEQRKKILIDLASLYGKQGLEREERQALLEALLVGEKQRVLALLAVSSIRENKLEEATGWLERLDPSWREKDTSAARTRDDQIFFSRFHLARILILLQEGRRKAAAELAENFFDLCQSSGVRPMQNEGQSLFWSLMELADAFFAADHFAEAGKALSTAGGMAFLPQDRVTLLVARAKVAQGAGDGQGADGFFARARQLAQDDETLQLVLVSEAQRQGFSDRVAGISLSLVDRYPDSLSAHLLVVENLSRQGRLEEALSATERAMADFQHSMQPALAAMHLNYRLGRFAQVLEIQERQGVRQASRMDLSLLVARALWSVGRHREAIAFYRSLLEPKATARFSEDEEAVRLPIPKPSWLDWLHREKREPLAEKLAPQNFATDREQAALDERAASLAALFSWQNHIERELAAREAVERFEFYRAGRLYKALLQEEANSDQSMLFDLAGIYSRLHRPNEEAAIYDMIAEENADYPGLREAIVQNSLKRRPQAGLFYTLKDEEGRDDKKAILRQAGGVAFWMALASSQELALRAERISYRSNLDPKEREWSNKAEIRYSSSFWQEINASLGAGFEKLDHNDSSLTLLHGGLNGELGDSFSWQFSYLRELTDDTVESLRANISRETVKIGSAFDFLPRLQLGIDYGVKVYKDGNLTEGYDLWTTYLLLTEPTELQLKYSYEFEDSKDSSYPDFFGLGGVDSNSEHPYYTPHNYWLNKFGVYFKHFLSAEKFGRGIPRYYELALSLGHDSAGHAVQTTHGAFFAQWKNHFLVEAAADLTTSEPYRSKEITLSIHYRW